MDSNDFDIVISPYGIGNKIASFAYVRFKRNFMQDIPFFYSNFNEIVPRSATDNNAELL